VIAQRLTSSLISMTLGVLGFAAGALALIKVRSAMDSDNQEAIKRWSFLTGILGFIPGLVAGGLLELFIWRAHAQETFTVFGLLGPAPQAVPEGAPSAAPAYSPAMEEMKRKSEYEALFAPAQAAAPADYGYAAGSGAYAESAPAYDYGQQAPAGDYGYAQGAEAQTAMAAAEAAPADAGTQYYQQPTGAPICSCGRPMEWVAEYQRYYCYTDDKYEGET
jgi:hypothetical protein